MTDTAGSVDSSIPVQQLVEALIKQVVRVVAVSWLLAWVLTKCSSYTLLNLPVALTLICLLRWLALHLDVRMRQEGVPAAPPLPKALSRASSRAHRHSLRRGAAHNAAVSWDHDTWRGMVNSKVVEFAWERLCNSIVQEWIYDAWYSSLTADTEFPAELRLILNSCFGEVCRRARRVDLRHLLVRHVSDVVKSHLELYRRTVYDSLGDSFQNIPTAAGRERALLNDLRTNPKDLHMALQTDDGHYKVLKQYSEGIVNKILPGEVHLPLIQTLVREVVATCVLRPVMYYFLPYSLNKLFLSMFETGSTSAVYASEGSAEFDNRARASAHQEQLHLEQRSAKVAERHDQRRRHHRSNSTLKNRTELEGKLKDGPGHSRTVSTPVRSSEDSARQALAAAPAFTSAQTSAWLDLHASPMPSPHVATTSQVDQPHAHSDSELVMDSEAVSPAQLDALLAAATPPPAGSRHHRSASTGTPHTSPRLLPTPPLSPFLPASAATTPIRVSSSNASAPVVDLSVDKPTTSGTGTGSKGGVVVGRASTEVHVQAIGRSGFDGWPRARVVTAMPRQDPTGANKDFVAYQIRVVDNSGEWTVDRRFRNFEALHKKLRDHPRLRDQVAVKLPAKNRLPFMANGHNTEFVEKRRAELDSYLSSLLSDWTVAMSEDVWEFLRQGSEVYGQDLGDGGLIRTFTSNMDLATKSMKKAMGDAFDEGRGRFSKLSSKVGDSANRVASVMPKSMLRLTNSPTKLRAGSTSMESTTFGPAVDLSVGSLSLSKGSEGVEGGDVQGLEVQSSSSVASSPSHGQTQAQAFAAAASADAQPTPAASPAPPAPNSGSSSPLTLSKSKLRPNKSLASSGQGSMSRRPSPRKKESLAESASLPPRDQDMDSYASLELADSSGISAPLYDLIDTLFDMQSRGFLRRQVIVSARQLLSLLAGDYVDTFLMSHLNNLRSEHTISHLIHTLQRELWPGGVWFATLQTPPPPPPAESPSTSTDKSAAQRPVIQPMLPEKFVDVNYRYGDEEEVAAAVKAKLLSTAPAALVRLIGPKAYQKSTMDLYNMLQSPTFTLMIGYRILEGVILALFPELEDMIQQYE